MTPSGSSSMLKSFERGEYMSANGLYRVDFGALLPGLPGIVVLENEVVRGGDGGYIYSGKFTGDQQSIEVSLKVKPIQADAPSVFGTVGQEFQLNLYGNFVPGGFVLAGAAPVPGGPRISIRGTKVSDLDF